MGLIVAGLCLTTALLAFSSAGYCVYDGALSYDCAGFSRPPPEEAWHTLFLPAAFCQYFVWVGPFFGFSSPLIRL